MQVVAAVPEVAVASGSAVEEEVTRKRICSKAAEEAAASPSKGNDGDKSEKKAEMLSPSKDKDGAETTKSLSLSQAQRNVSSRFRTCEDIQRASFMDLLKDQPVLKPFKHALHRCLTKGDMEDMPVEALTIDAVETFHEFQDKWEDAVECAGELMTSVVQASNDVLGHIKGAERMKLRKVKAESLQKEKEELKKIREQAAAAAQAIRSKAGNQDGPAVFAMDFKGSGHITPVPKLAAPPAMASDAWSLPFVLEDSDEIKLFFGNKTLTKTMTSYATSHTKTLQKAKGSTLGRDQIRIDDVDVLDTCTETMHTMLPEHDISKIEGGETFMKGVYLFGYDGHPKMHYIGLTPSQASMVKFLFVGQVKTLLIKLSSLVKVSSETVGPAAENLDYFEGVGSWDAAKLKQFSDAGVGMYEIIHSSNQMLYVPQGWLTLETTLPGAPVHYGIRKAFFMNTEPAIAEYESALMLFKASARDVTKATAILDSMKFTE